MSVNHEALNMLVVRVSKYKELGWKVSGKGYYQVQLSKGKKIMTLKICPDTYVMGTVI